MDTTAIPHTDLQIRGRMKTNKMIDIHNHALYGVDDGSSDMDMSLTLLRDAYKDGIRKLIITPHYMYGEKYCHKAEEILDRFEALKKAVQDEGNQIELFIGNEIMISSHIDELLERKEILTLAGTDYVLVEFPFNDYLDEYDEYLYNITTLGYKIIIAHPERYEYVQRNHAFVDRWLNEGYYLQSNGDSLFAKGLGKLVIKLISQGKLSFIASDGHRTEWRPILLQKSYMCIEKAFGSGIADSLFGGNQQCLLKNQPIPLMPAVKRKGFSLFD